MLTLSAMALPPVETVPISALSSNQVDWLRVSPLNEVSTPVAFTGSMKPYLLGGEILFIERYDGQSLEVGMLILFARWDKPAVLHEIMALSPHGYFKAKGLNCMSADGWYPVKRVKWIARRVIRVTYPVGA